jgi:3-deoxy-7-phosphoheptulonate synthase
MVDFSHANSKKDHNNQIKVCRDVSLQIAEWNENIVAVMIESNLYEDNQSHTPWVNDPKNLKYGVSITDKCVDIDINTQMLEMLNDAAEVRNQKNNVPQWPGYAG